MGETSTLRGKYKGLLSPSHTLLADRERHSDYDLAFQMNCDFHRIDNQRGTIKQMFVQLAAKDAEIAELRQQLAEAQESFVITIQVVRGERDEARECARRLYGELMSAVNAGRVDIDSDDYFWRRIIEALAATPEHLRNG